MISGWGSKRKALLCAGVALGLLAPAADAAAQTTGSPPPAPRPAPPPAPAPPSPPAPPAGPEPEPRQDDNNIVVTAPSQQSSIDRQTYLVRDTPEARSATTNDILERIPSVEVQADGSVRLVGAGNATILIDGRRVADPQTMLRNMTGNQIERIEVMTNPGAQFPAQGTGGIVNIVTRRNTQNGLGGSATVSGGSYGSYDIRISPTYGTGNWTFMGSVGHGRFEQQTRFERDRFSLPGPVLVSSEDGEQIDQGRYYYGNGSASYRPTDRSTFTLAGTLAHTDFSSERPSVLTAAALPGGNADVLSINEANFNYRDLGLDYRGTTSRQGEMLTASIKWSRFSGDFDRMFSTDPVGGPPNIFLQQQTMSDENWTAKVDYVRPFANSERLSIGAQLVTTSNRLAQTAAGTLPSGAPFAASSLVDGSWFEYAGYATYQFELAGFTIMPGVRVEGRQYDLGGTTGVPDLKTVNVFPSLHMERQLAEWLTGTASYSRRITYPPIQLLNPALNFQDATTAQAGNPLLEPQFTDSYEVRLRGQVSRHNLELVAFRRTTTDIWSFRGEVNPDGVLVTRPFNFGSQALTGAELSARGPILEGLRYVLTANLSDQSLDQDGGGPLPSRHGATWSGTGQLEYQDGQVGRAGADRVNLTLRYFGPTDTGFTRVEPFALATFTWSHAFTDRLSGVLTVQNLRLTEGRESITTGITSQSRDLFAPASPQRITLALTWSFRPPGQGPRVQQQQQAAPPIPGAPGGPG